MKALVTITSSDFYHEITGKKIRHDIAYAISERVDLEINGRERTGMDVHVLWASPFNEESSHNAVSFYITLKLFVEVNADQILGIVSAIKRAFDISPDIHYGSTFIIEIMPQSSDSGIFEFVKA